jgi:hypothetical protein
MNDKKETRIREFLGFMAAGSGMATFFEKPPVY